jgi:hypothetical protein
MSGFKSYYLCDKLLDHVLGGGDYARPSPVYFALFTVAPTGAGGGTEVSGGGYARIAKTNNSTNFPAASSQTKKNGTVIDFGTASADWGDVMGCGVFDAPTGGNLLIYGPFSVTRTIRNGDSFSIAVNGMTYTEA